ncbi:MAG: response regulator [Chloroflexi bacterium]|nr:response regulator [Chloroflexota bacterium]
MSPEPGPAQPQKRILIADDELLNRELLYRMLRSAAEVSEAATGRQALDMIENEHFDLVLLDVLMPGLTGIEVLKMIRAMPQTANLPVIMISEFTRDDEVVRGLEIDDADYLLKPIDLDALLARVETYLSRRE